MCTGLASQPDIGWLQGSDLVLYSDLGISTFLLLPSQATGLLNYLAAEILNFLEPKVNCSRNI